MLALGTERTRWLVLRGRSNHTFPDIGGGAGAREPAIVDTAAGSVDRSTARKISSTGAEMRFGNDILKLLQRWDGVADIRM